MSPHLKSAIAGENNLLWLSAQTEKGKPVSESLPGPKGTETFLCFSEKMCFQSREMNSHREHLTHDPQGYKFE